MDRVNILDIWVYAIKKEEVLDWLKNKIASPFEKTHLVATTYSEFIVQAQKDKKFKNILNSFDLNLADGVGILWAASFLNEPPASLRGGEKPTKQSRRLPRSSPVGESLAMTLAQFLKTAYWTAFKQSKIKNIIPEQISGADLIFDICEIAQKQDASVFFLGGHGPIDKVLKNKYPDLKIAGRYEGSPQEQGMVERVNESDADILLFAFGPVKQEKWLWNNRQNLKVKIAVGLGGTFDYILGNRSRARKWWREHGLEWLYRLITQPWRARRMWNAVIVFTYIVIKDKIKRV